MSGNNCEVYETFHEVFLMFSEFSRLFSRGDHTKTPKFNCSLFLLLEFELVVSADCACVSYSVHQQNVGGDFPQLLSSAVSSLHHACYVPLYNISFWKPEMLTNFLKLSKVTIELRTYSIQFCLL